MCSNSGCDSNGGFLEGLPESLDSSSGSNHETCNKCGKEDGVYKLQFRQAECRDCFLLYVCHKFRAALGSSKVLPRDASILVIFDGSAEAVMLVDMLYHATMQSAFKRLHCKGCMILYINEEKWKHPNATEEAHRQSVLKFRNFCNKYVGFKNFITSISNGHETLFALEDIELYLKRDTSLEKQFVDSVASMHTLTSSQEYVKYYRNKMIANAATQLNCNFVFLPDVSTTIATNFLSAVILGRGYSAALDVNMTDCRLEADAILIRPIRDLTTEEVRLYLKAKELEALVFDCFGQSGSKTISLQNVTAAFINDLQKNYPSTICTIFRTGNKVALNTETLEENKSNDCAFCHSPLDHGFSNTLSALEFSRLVSEMGSKPMLAPQLTTVTEEILSKNNQIEHICYACQNIVNDANNKVKIL